ncbi:MAG: hypothetical protein ACYS5W_00240 [Planctomycetota bacterium]
MSLPSEAVYPILQRDFVLGWKNIRREDYVGGSFGYTRRQACVGTTNGAGAHNVQIFTNGAGAHNVQIFVLSKDLTVLHALPGFWHPDDLARELRFAKVLLRLWKDETRTEKQKREMYQRLQLAELRFQPAVMYARSDWQEFDKTREGAAVSKDKDRDTFKHTKDGEVKRNARGAPILKALNVLTHERMAERPFVKFKDFDIVRFVDYGTKFYDNNRGVDGRGKRFR